VAARGLPPGTTGDALADGLVHESPEAAMALRTAEHAAFSPASPETIDIEPLLRATWKLPALLAGVATGLSLTWVPAHASPGSRSQDSLWAVFAEAGMACDRDQAAAAYALYSQIEMPGCDNASLAVNRADCALRMGRTGEALALLEKARRLAPRDREVLGNLAFLRQQLSLSEPDASLPGPAAWITRWRDCLRPDEWLLVAAMSWLCWGVLAGWQRVRGSSTAVTAVVASAATAVALLACGTQLRSTYRPGSEAVATAAEAPLYRLPSAHVTEPFMHLPLGETLRIAAERPGWYRVRTRHGEGWAEKGCVGVIW
jgi:hypothetical protein